MGSGFPSHQLSNGLYVSGRPEQPKEKPVIMSSGAMPYTGGDIKKSGELGKMFDVHAENSKSRKSGPVSGAPSRTGSFGGAAAHSGPINSNSGVRSSYSSGPVPSNPITGSSSRHKSNSGPLNRHGDPMKKSSGPQSGGVTPMTRQNSGPIHPLLPATGLITSGPISSGPLNTSGAPRRVSGSLDSTGSVKLHSTSIAHNQAVTKLNKEDDYSFKGNLPKAIMWSVILLFLMGFIAGGFILGAVHNAILLIVVVVIFGFVAALFIWNSCWGRRAMVGFIARYPDAELRTAKNGQYIKISGRISIAFDDDLALKMHANFDESFKFEQFALASSVLHECSREYADAKENIQRHSFTVDQQAASLLKIMGIVQKNLSSHKEVSESLEKNVVNLEMMMKEKDAEIYLMKRNLSLLYEACGHSIAEIENRQAQVDGTFLPPGEHAAGESGAFKKLQNYVDGQDNADGRFSSITDECVRTMADMLLSAVKGSSNINEIAEGNTQELKATISGLQGELQEKDIQTSRICAELVSQIREAEAVAKKSVADLNSAREQVYSLERQVKTMESDRKLLEMRLDEFKGCEASFKDLQEKIKSLNIKLSSKDHEIEALMQALDEEETQMEDLETQRKELENIVHEKTLEMESLESSRLKAVSKLSTTVSKFDELHNLSESLLSEIESLQLQLQGRDSEVSFLRQEVTRCTDDILASKEANKKYFSALCELRTWMDLMLSRIGVPHLGIREEEDSELHAYRDTIEKKVVCILTELDDLRKLAERKDALLQIERGRVEELSCKAEVLDTSLRERESKVQLFRGRTDAGQPSSTSAQVPSNLEEMGHNVSQGPIRTHVRGGRKINDQVAVAIDIGHGDTVLEDEDDDKAHGFKSLTMSRIVPRATRPLVDRIDGIWVSGERLLMRQPTLRLGLILYWIALHIFLVSVV